MTKNRVISIIVAVGTVLIAVFAMGLYSKTPSTPPPPTKQTNQESGVKVVSTNLSEGDVSVISPTQDIEITFNKPMVQDNTRISMDPKIGYRTELSSDHKTIKIIPDKPFDLGKDYTLTIKSGYGTDTSEHLDSDQVFHFKTISYNGV